MATSSPGIGIAQVPVSCYFCKGQDIKWTCVNCNVRMCNSCKITVHQGFQCSQDHDVISIQDIRPPSPGSQAVISVVISSGLNSYTTTLPAVHTLLCSDDDSLYFIYNGQKSDKLQFLKGKLFQSSIKILRMLKRIICDIAINKKDEIFFIERHDNKIKKSSVVGEIKTVVDTCKMTLMAIHVNKDNEVMIEIREPGPPFPVHDFSVRQVIILGSDYKRKVTLEFDRKWNKLFSYVFRIRTNSKNVVDHSQYNGRIVAVDRNGCLKFTYGEQTDFGTFRPTGITITSSINIVVADRSNNALHVINSKGDLLGLQFIFKDLNIYDPYSVCFDTKGYLLIGCGKGENEDYGKIHVVKMIDRLT